MSAETNRDVVLRVDRLSIGRRGGPLLVDDVSFEIERGRTLGIVGESGSGKSLTCKAILGILPESLEIRSGSIEFEGHDVTHYGYRDWLPLRGDRVSAIFQDPASYLNPVIKVGAQLEEVLRIRGQMSRAEAYDRAIALFRAVGLRDALEVYDRHPYQLSGGMVQRVVIAIALALNPDLLIADEATTALDVTVQAEILRLLAGLRDSRDMSLLFVSHDLAVISQISETVVVMQHGRIIESGPTRRVLSAPQHEYTQLLVRDHEEYGLDRFVNRRRVAA